MDSHKNCPNWAYFSPGKGMEELKQSLLYSSLELEQTRIAAQDELRKRDNQLLHFKDLLTKTIRERDEAIENCQTLLTEKQQQNAPISGISSIEDEPRRPIDSNNGFSSSDCEESIVSPPVIDPIPPQLAPPALELLPQKPLPEKGKLLQAVMKAGPLLQTLLLAGPLPQWRHPPPPLESFEIPPVAIPSPPPPQLLHQDSLISVNSCYRKRAHSDGSDSPVETKHQRILY